MQDLKKQINEKRISVWILDIFVKKCYDNLEKLLHQLQGQEANKSNNCQSTSIFCLQQSRTDLVSEEQQNCTSKRNKHGICHIEKKEFELLMRVRVKEAMQLFAVQEAVLRREEMSLLELTTMENSLKQKEDRNKAIK